MTITFFGSQPATCESRRRATAPPCRQAEAAMKAADHLSNFVAAQVDESFTGRTMGETIKTGFYVFK